jgi:penicillin-insensitive murein endopeptidase
MEQLAAAYRKRFPTAPPLLVQEISLRHGGPICRHNSHRQGLDVDLRLPLRWRLGYVNATPRTLHVRRLWFMISTLIKTCDVEFILLDRKLQRPLWVHALRQGLLPSQLDLILEYPNRPTGWHPARPQDAIVRHLRGHANHLHVRFRTPGKPLRGHSARRLCGKKAP